MFDIIMVFSAREMALADLGYKFETGAGISGAQKVFMQNNYLNI